MRAWCVFALAGIGMGVVLGGSLAQQGYTVCPQGPPTCPFKKIAEAVAAAEPGSTITLGPGSYREQIVIGKSLIIRGNGRTTTLLRASSEDFTIVINNTAQVVIEGLRIEGPQEEFFAACGIHVTDRARLSLHSALLLRGKLGVFVEGEAQAEIYNTVISDYVDTAITVRGKAQLTLGYNLLRKNRRNLSLYVSAQGLIEANEIIGGLTEFSGDARVTLRGNRFVAYATPFFYEESELRILNDETHLYNNEFISYKIDVFGTTRLIMEGNKLHGQGISLFDASSGVLVGNEITQAKFGLFVRSSGSVEIQKNHMSGHDGRGIEIGHAKAILRENRISDNNSDGVVLFGSINAEILDNQIINNKGWGISTLSDECYDLRQLRDRSPEDLFRGTVTGSANELKDNTKGDLCGVPDSLKKP